MATSFFLRAGIFPILRADPESFSRRISRTASIPFSEKALITDGERATFRGDYASVKGKRYIAQGQRIQSGFPKLELVLDSNSSFLKLYYMN